MTRRMVKAAWAALGVCLVGGTLAGMLAWVGPPVSRCIGPCRSYSTLLDVAASCSGLQSSRSTGRGPADPARERKQGLTGPSHERALMPCNSGKHADRLVHEGLRPVRAPLLLQTR